MTRFSCQLKLWDTKRMLIAMLLTSSTTIFAQKKKDKNEFFFNDTIALFHDTAQVRNCNYINDSLKYETVGFFFLDTITINSRHKFLPFFKTKTRFNVYRIMEHGEQVEYHNGMRKITSYHYGLIKDVKYLDKENKQVDILKYNHFDTGPCGTDIQQYIILGVVK